MKPPTANLNDKPRGLIKAQNIIPKPMLAIFYHSPDDKVELY